jgi:large subunit ribosomal protein L5
MAQEPNFKIKYKEEVVPHLNTKFGYSNYMEMPKLSKICLNQGIGDAVNDKKLVDTAVEEMSLITGQKAQPTYAKKDISNFKLRSKMPIGCKVTLRADKMYEFMERLICIALPRERDFQGLPVKGFDGRGNYTMGISEQIIFPEINIDKTNRIAGMDITFVTTAKTDEECLELLKSFGFPFKQN